MGTEEGNVNYLTLQNPDPNVKVKYPKWKSEELVIMLRDPYRINFTFVAPASGENSKLALDMIKAVRYDCAYSDLPRPVSAVREYSL